MGCRKLQTNYYLSKTSGGNTDTYTSKKPFTAEKTYKRFFRSLSFPGEDLIAETNHATSKTYLALHDGNKNIVGYVDASDGTSVADYEYSPFGKLIVKSGTMADDMTFRFAGYFYDVETGLTYLGYRYYDSDKGRFVNRDPIEELGGVGLYCYCVNDIINFWDYLGREQTRPPKVPTTDAERYSEEGIKYFESNLHLFIGKKTWKWAAFKQGSGISATALQKKYGWVGFTKDLDISDIEKTGACTIVVALGVHPSKDMKFKKWFWRSKKEDRRLVWAPLIFPIVSSSASPGLKNKNYNAFEDNKYFKYSELWNDNPQNGGYHMFKLSFYGRKKYFPNPMGWSDDLISWYVHIIKVEDLKKWKTNKITIYLKMKSWLSNETKRKNIWFDTNKDPVIKDIESKTLKVVP